MSTRLTSCKWLSDLIKRAEKAGWIVTTRRGGHLQWTPPGDGQFVITSASPSDWRSRKHILRDLRVYGGLDLR